MNPINPTSFLFLASGSAFAGWAFVTGCLGGVIGWGLFRLVCTLGDWEITRLPPCEEGKCNSWDDYEYFMEKRDGYFQCRCGHRYVLLKNSHFLKLHADGSTEPYLKRRFGRPWQPERK